MGQGSSSNHGGKNHISTGTHFSQHAENLNGFKDLKELPPEVAITILSNLNATDLCLASCVWKNLAEDEILWRELCLSKWRYTSVYRHLKDGKDDTQISKWKKKPLYKTLYLLLDEASLIFAFKGHQGIQYLIDNGVLFDNSTEIAKFINEASCLNKCSLQLYLQERTDVLDDLVNLQDFTGLSLCDSLRKFFRKVYPPKQQGVLLALLVDKFANKFHENNPECGFSKDSMSVLCYSLLLLSVDLYSPHVKNKMSKREFRRNNRQVLVDANAEILGDLYDDVYLNGHIVPDAYQQVKVRRFPFYRPYGVIFEFKPPQLKLNCSC